MKVIEGKFGAKESAPEPNQAIVGHLETLLEWAQAGKIQHFAFACNGENAMYGYAAAPDTDGYALSGMLQTANLQLLDFLQYSEQQGDDE